MFACRLSVFLACWPCALIVHCKDGLSRWRDPRAGKYREGKAIRKQRQQQQQQPQQQQPQTQTQTQLVLYKLVSVSTYEVTMKIMKVDQYKSKTTQTISDGQQDPASVEPQNVTLQSNSGDWCHPLLSTFWHRMPCLKFLGERCNGIPSYVTGTGFMPSTWHMPSM